MQQTNLAAIVALLVTLGPSIYWLVNLVVNLKNGAKNGSATQALALLIAFGLANLVAHAGIAIGSVGNPLANLTWQALLLASIVFAASSGLIADHQRARNNADSTVRGKLLKD